MGIQGKETSPDVGCAALRWSCPCSFSSSFFRSDRMTRPTEGLALVFVGAKVRLVGLQARKDLNDRLALVTSKYADEEPVRWGVELRDDTTSRASSPPTRLKVKAANLRVAEWC